MARSALYNLVPPADVATGGLRFRARSITVNNTTGQWWDVDGLPVSPYTIGVVISLRGPSEAPRVRARTPVGFTSTLVAGETGTIIFDEAQLPASPGVPFTRAATAATILAGATSSGFSVAGTWPPASVAIPAGSAGDQYILLIGMQQRGVGAPPATIAVPGWTARDNIGQNTGAAGMRLQTFTFPNGTMPAAITAIPAGASGGYAQVIAIAGSTAYVGGAFNGSIVAGLTLAVPIFAGGVVCIAMLMGYTLAAPPSLSSWAPPGTLIVQDLNSGLDPGDAATRFQIQVMRTALQTTVSEQCTVSANYNAMLAGISITV